MLYDVFISYAHRDNARGQVRELRDAIAADFHKFAGRDLRTFFDEHDIPSMTAWETRIAQGLRESRLFLAVISPNYFASVYCRRESEEYLRYEAMRQCLGEGVAPVYFIELPGLDGTGVEQSIAAAVDEMRKRQWCDLASQEPVKIVPWHDAGKHALEDAEVARRLHALKVQMAERISRADRSLQSPTNTYRHNPQFVGRVRELTLLREALNERGSVGVVGHQTETPLGAAAVHGLGGMGKTEIALAYAHAFAWDYPGGRWLARCEGLDNFDLVLRQLAEPLHVEFSEDEKKDAHIAGERILAELRRRERSLLLLDNVTHAALLSPDALMRLPPQGHIHLLASTRLGPAQLGGSPHDHTFVTVDELPVDDALALIRAHQPEGRFASAVDEAAALDLVSLLAGFTLAVETAAIYLGRHAMPDAVAAYVERVRRELLAESEAAAADPMVAVRHKEKLLERTLAITFETLSTEQLYVLALAASLPSDQIALPWLRAVASSRFPILMSDHGTASDASWQPLPDSLLSLRLFQPGGDAHIVRMHRMVQEAVKKHSADEVAQIQPTLLAHIMSRATTLRSNWVQETLRWELPPMLASALQFLSVGSKEGVLLSDKLEWLLERFGRFEEAEQLARKAVVCAEQLFGSDDPNLASCLINLSAACQAKNKNEEAEVMLRRALAIYEEHLAEFHPFVATALNNLAQLLQHTNRLAEAEPLMRRALAIHETDIGTSRAEVSGDLNNLALLLKKTNRVAEAEPLIRRAIGIDTQIFGESHPDTGRDLGHLALLLMDIGRLTEAEPLLRRALAINEECFGSEHVVVSEALNSLGLLLKRTSRLSEAEPLMRRALAIDENRFGPNHPTVAIRLNNLAQILGAANRLSEAEPLVRRALAIDEQSLGPSHPNVAVRLNNLSQLLQATERLDEAEPMMRRALAIDERSFGREHPDVARDLNNLGSLLKITGHLDDAEPLMKRMVRILLKVGHANGHEHPNLSPAVGNYFSLLCEMGISKDTAMAKLNDLGSQFGMTFGEGE